MSSPKHEPDGNGRPSGEGACLSHLDHWAGVDKAFKRALDLDPARRADVLAELAERDLKAAQDVASLLHHHDASGSFIQTPLLGKDFQLAPPAELTGAISPLPPGAAAGGYRIQRLLARSALAIVYEAQQHAPPRPVALKVLRADLPPGVLRRLQDEALVLARLRHHGIAQVYESGTIGDDPPAPFLAVEYVPDARPLTEHADAQRLTLDQRLALFLDVCDAVQHAHQRGVIHRDLKPSNILVGDAGRPKVIDFGIAKFIDAECDRTVVGDLMGTPRYMSPEQCAGDPHAVDVRTDVYSLGVVLYELLCGGLPYQVPADLYQAARAIRDTPPRRPSAANPRVRDDLECVLLTALTKDPAVRYQSVTDLAADLRRVLQRRPIQARSPTLRRRLGLLIRRNPALAALAAALVLSIVAGVAGMALAAVVAERQRRVAEEAAEFLERMLAAPQVAQEGSGVRVVSVLRAAEEDLGKSFHGAPETAHRLRLALGRTYDILGLPDDAHRQFSLALELARRAFDPDDPRVLTTMVELAGPLYDRGRYDEAERTLIEVLNTQRASLGPTHLDTAKTENDLALIYLRTDRPALGGALLHRSLASRRRHLGPDHPDVAQSFLNLGAAMGLQDELQEAERLLRESIAAYERAIGPGCAGAARATELLADVLRRTGRLDEARRLGLRALEDTARSSGLSHPRYAGALATLGRIERDRGDTAAAADLLTRALATYGVDHPRTDELAADLAALGAP